MIKLICYRKCSTCKDVIKRMDALGMEYETREIDLENPTVAELKEWHEKSGLDIGRFYNTSGIKYREMEISKKRKTMGEEEQLELLATDGMLVKRPILFYKDSIYVGPDVKKFLETLE